ncbi:MAG: 50S ribosomal protein L23 [Gemmatimonadota bacterium]
MAEARDVIIRPVVTEQTMLMGGGQFAGGEDTANAYVFIVRRDANKIEIRKAVENLFDVKVEAVRTMNYRGKVRRVGRIAGKRAAFKKAVVRLAAGETIDVYEGV